jgi:cyclase
MAIPRVIPVLLLRKKGLVKSVRFKEHRYVGDPINAVKIFNEKEVDEIIIIDIDASSEKREPDFDYIKEIASECFMPLAYGGGVTSCAQIKRLIQSGVEKIVINHAAQADKAFVKTAVEVFGSSTIVGAIDIKKNLLGTHMVYSHTERKTMSIDPTLVAQELQSLGVGELFLNNVDRDGMMTGYDIPLLKKIQSVISIPLIACGGAAGIQDIERAIIEGNASAAAAGSMFVYHGKHKAVLITYPEWNALNDIFSKTVIAD